MDFQCGLTAFPNVGSSSSDDSFYEMRTFSSVTLFLPCIGLNLCSSVPKALTLMNSFLHQTLLGSCLISCQVFALPSTAHQVRGYDLECLFVVSVRTAIIGHLLCICQLLSCLMLSMVYKKILSVADNATGITPKKSHSLPPVEPLSAVIGFP